MSKKLFFFGSPLLAWSLILSLLVMKESYFSSIILKKKLGIKVVRPNRTQKACWLPLSGAVLKMEPPHWTNKYYVSAMKRKTKMK